MGVPKKSFFSVDCLWLFFGVVLLIFNGGKWNIPLATVVAPIFLIRFFRQQKDWLKILGAIPIIGVSMILWLYQVVPLPPDVPLFVFILLVIYLTITTIIPYLIDRVLYKKFSFPLNLLTFPTIITLCQYFFATFGPTGSSHAWAQNLFEFTSFIQLLSLTGLWGITFIIGWFASIVNLLLENKFDLQKLKKPVLIFVFCLSIVFFYGGFRLAVLEPTSETVKIGSVVVAWPVAENEFWNYVNSGTSKEKADQYRPALKELENQLFLQSERLIASGVKIVMWPVGNVTLFEDSEAEFISRAQKFAQDHQIYFFPAILMLKYDQNECENKVLAIQPDGKIAYTYYKSKPSPGEPLPDAPNILWSLDTPYGRISTAICYDMYFPQLIKQAGRQNVDILLVPADEPTRQLDPIDTFNAMIRGVENGCSVLRTTLEGLTMGIDYQGNVLSRMSYYTTTADRMMITHLPIKGVTTFYTIAGDWFIYLLIILLIGMILYNQYDRSKKHIMLWNLIKNKFTF